MEAVENISGIASKEWSMLKTLQKMNKDWDGKEFMCMPYKDSGTFILASTDDIQAILDDQIVKIQAMSASPFAKPFKDQVNGVEHVIRKAAIITSELGIEKGLRIYAAVRNIKDQLLRS